VLLLWVISIVVNVACAERFVIVMSLHRDFCVVVRHVFAHHLGLATFLGTIGLFWRCCSFPAFLP